MSKNAIEQLRDVFGFAGPLNPRKEGTKIPSITWSCVSIEDYYGELELLEVPVAPFEGMKEVRDQEQQALARLEQARYTLGHSINRVSRFCAKVSVHRYYPLYEEAHSQLVVLKPAELAS